MIVKGEAHAERHQPELRRVAVPGHGQRSGLHIRLQGVRFQNFDVDCIKKSICSVKICAFLNIFVDEVFQYGRG